MSWKACGALAKRRCAGLAAALGVAALLGVAARAETGLTIRNRFEKTFALHGFEPGPARESRAGDTQPGPGEMTVGMSSTYAVGRPKLHVFERTTKPIAFKVTSMQGRKRLGTDELCGRLDTDAWIVLPETTSRVVLSDFVEVEGDCP